MRSPRLLLTEPDSFFAACATRHLRRAGFDVVHASHGEEGLELLSRESFDLVVMELVLPRLDGYQLLEAVRAKDLCANLPIYVLTRLGTREDVERCRSHGVRDYFIKPHHTLDAIAARLVRAWQQTTHQPA